VVSVTQSDEDQLKVDVEAEVEELLYEMHLYANHEDRGRGDGR